MSIKSRVTKLVSGLSDSRKNSSEVSQGEDVQTPRPEQEMGGHWNSPPNEEGL